MTAFFSSGLMAGMDRLRVSAISYLNTAPLMWDFDHGRLRTRYKVDYTLPSVCAESLKNGMTDIGTIPVAAYATVPDLRIIGDVCIASKGAVRSIYLVSKKPAEEAQSVAVDTSSRSSVALLRVLFSEKWKSAPRFTPADPKIKAMLNDHDAALLIGDPALKVGFDHTAAGHRLYDLGSEWQELTGLPFVYAFWAVRDVVAKPSLVNDFEHSRNHGLEYENLNRTAAEWAPRLDLQPGDIRKYLTQNIHYSLDDDCRRGLLRFFALAHDCGALPRASELRFL